MCRTGDTFLYFSIFSAQNIKFCGILVTLILMISQTLPSSCVLCRLIFFFRIIFVYSIFYGDKIGIFWKDTFGKLNAIHNSFFYLAKFLRFFNALIL